FTETRDCKFSSPPRYDRFDMPPYGYSVFWSLSSAKRFSRLVPFLKHSRPLRRRKLGSIASCFSESLAKTTHSAILPSLPRYDHFAYPTRRSTSLLVRRRVWVSSL
ncbi:MAG: hypothetical protein IKM34_00895, partial [Clostridia bacterium]|nr:hypothetical protein [Clostridia bacterium]